MVHGLTNKSKRYIFFVERDEIPLNKDGTIDISVKYTYRISRAEILTFYALKTKTLESTRGKGDYKRYTSLWLLSR